MCSQAAVLAAPFSCGQLPTLNAKLRYKTKRCTERLENNVLNIQLWSDLLDFLEQTCARLNGHNF